MSRVFQVIVIGGGHAGAEAAWAAANLLPVDGGPVPRASVALVTLDPSKIGVMSCNPAIGGLAKGQIVREVDALGGLMGLAADATGIQFKVLNQSKGPAVQGPRAQCDKHAYAEAVQRLIASRPEIEVVAGSVEELLVDARGGGGGGGGGAGGVLGVVIRSAAAGSEGSLVELTAPSVVLTTGTFMRGLMHTGESKTPGGRFGEAAAIGISGALKSLGFELGRLKTGTPPRLKRGTIDWDALEQQHGDPVPTAFSDLSGHAASLIDSGGNGAGSLAAEWGGGGTFAPSLARFPVLEQTSCRMTATNAAVHEHIRANIHRAPMYSGQIESSGPRYCPSIEDKVVRFRERETHQIFLEPESHRDDWIYCNGISTSLPADVQDVIVRSMPGCEQAHIYRYGYAVEYDMVRPHQIAATGMTKLIDGLFLAGQINGTSGYEEAAAQGMVAGINAARFARRQELITFGRDQAYIGVLMDDLVTKTPVEPYRMFTSRAEHRLMLRSDNAADRLTPIAKTLGLLETTALGRLRQRTFEARQARMSEVGRAIAAVRVDRVPLGDLIRRPEFTVDHLAAALREHAPESLGEPVRSPTDRAALFTAYTERVYEAYITRQHAEIKRQSEMERKRLPVVIDYAALTDLRAEARDALARFRPSTFGQAARLEGITPADLTLLAVLLRKRGEAAAAS